MSILPASTRLDEPVQSKLDSLENLLRGYRSLIVAYSGGVDSAFLAVAAHAVLGENALAVSAVSPSFPESERRRAAEIADAVGLRHRFIETKEMDNPDFVKNDAFRCAHCKRALMDALKSVAEQEGIAEIALGEIVDDATDYRPGESAAKARGAVFPLRDANLTKADIRVASRVLNLPTWNLPASACLASRLPYGTPISAERLGQVERAEAVLKDLGFRLVRVRHHGRIARIELGAEDMPRMIGEVADAVVAELREIGFTFVTLDLAGYRTGSLNALLSETEIENSQTGG